jgi:hypothetical protein
MSRIGWQRFGLSKVTSHNKMLNIVRYALWDASQQAAPRPLA